MLRTSVSLTYIAVSLQISSGQSANVASTSSGTACESSLPGISPCIEAIDGNKGNVRSPESAWIFSGYPVDEWILITFPSSHYLWRISLHIYLADRNFDRLLLSFSDQSTTNWILQGTSDIEYFYPHIVYTSYLRITIKNSFGKNINVISEVYCYASSTQMESRTHPPGFISPSPFTQLPLEQNERLVDDSSSSSESDQGDTNVIVGGVVGGTLACVVIVCVTVTVIFYIRRISSKGNGQSKTERTPDTPLSTITGPGSYTGLTTSAAAQQLYEDVDNIQSNCQSV